MNNNELEQAHNLLLETAEVMTQFRQSTHQIVQNLEDKLDKSLYDQRKMITEMVRAEVTKEMSNSVAGYVRDMEKARNQMADQVREFNAYLNKVNEENQKISSRLVWIISLAMATLVIGGLALSFFYTMLIDQKRQDADMVGRINRANIVRCGDELCAKTGKSVENGSAIAQISRILGLCDAEVFCMPQGYDKISLEENANSVAQFAVRHGFCYSDRIHIRLWGDKEGV